MEPFQFQNPRDKRIHDKLKFIGPGPAAFFKDILRIWKLDRQFLESETHLVSHLFREIESALRDTLRTEDEKPKGGSKNHLEDVKKILGKLDISLEHPVAELWLRFADKSFKYQFNKLAHRDSLVAPRERKIEIIESWNDFLTVLEYIIEQFKENYFIAIEVIDNVLKREHPSKKDAKIIAGNIPHNQATLSYLFDKCNNPDWLPLFRTKGFFQHPPPTIYNEDGSWQYPPWPAGKFIQKMASKNPSEISEIIHEVPDTDNLSAIDDLVYALGSMPPEIAARHSETIIRWMGKGSLSYRAEPYMEYAIHLAKKDFKEDALAIIKELLIPEFPDKSEEQTGVGRRISSTHLKVSDYEFRTFFNEQMQSYLPALGFELVKLLADILNEVLNYSYEDPPADMSHMWKQKINFEDPDYTGYRHEIKETLVDAIASLTDYLINEGDTTIQEATSCFDSYDWSIFRRLSALLCSRQKSMKNIRAILLDKNNFEDYSIRYEYRLLLERHYPSLTEDEQEILLQWIKKGPNREDVVQFLEQRDGESTEEKIAAYVKQWQRRKLFPISKYLEEDWKDHYEQLINKYGEPDFESSGVRSFVGPTTPKTIPELNELSVKELISYLQSWQPEEGFAKPTPEGLGRALLSVIADNADEVSQHALAFKNLEPTYVRALFEGLRSAAKNEDPIHWEQVLKLANWVLAQPLEEPKDELYRSKDPGWGWCRSAIASVLEQGCNAKSATIPFQYRKQVWECLTILAEDPNPDQNHEAKYGGDNMDPSTLSINTTRGKAIHAVFAYGWWVKRNLKKLSTNIEFSFDDIPEVQAVLENHLDLDYDPSLAIRSVYGQHLIDLFDFDTEWLKDHLHIIFPLEEDSQNYFIAAWDAYIAFSKVYDNVFEILALVYMEALDLTNTESFGNHLRSDQNFVEHLIILYWRGTIVPGGRYSEILDKFWRDAPEDLRKHALEFTGQYISKWQEATDPDITGKIHEYIARRINTAKQADNVEYYKEELAGYGWCFESRALDKDKRIQYLTEILRLTDEIDQSHSVIETLNNEFTDEYPEEVLECIELMVKETNKNLTFFGWKKDLKDILKSLLDQKDPIAQKASGLVQYICQRSYHLMQEFKPLLD